MERQQDTMFHLFPLVSKTNLNLIYIRTFLLFFLTAIKKINPRQEIWQVKIRECHHNTRSPHKNNNHEKKKRKAKILPRKHTSRKFYSEKKEKIGKGIFLSPTKGIKVIEYHHIQVIRRKRSLNKRNHVGRNQRGQKFLSKGDHMGQGARREIIWEEISRAFATWVWAKNKTFCSDKKSAKWEYKTGSDSSVMVPFPSRDARIQKLQI